ncbi:hypothetical protein [Sulfitobacter sp. 915]|uniref:hypothetical protein n=1 Tax=Sulfitobacter sp. 915 TaxID=3368558 RepID=UPI003746CBB7
MSNALDDLIAAVEAGEAPPIYGRADPCGLGQGRIYLQDAFNGSLDAARALHEAALPQWDWSIHDCQAFLRTGSADYDDEVVVEGINAEPARAWLLAILRAMKEGKDA